MARLDRILYLLLALLIAAIPFEFRPFQLLSSLQWIFILIGIVSLPIIYRERRGLLHNRQVLAALVFVVVQWAAAALAPEFTTNAVKGAVRYSAGLTLLCATLCVWNPSSLLPVWSVSAVLAAVYGILDYAGYGVPRLFHEGNFYTGTALRLSGSFEYPNTAAAFFALSLPIIWTTLKRPWLRFGSVVLVWIALLLTYSRGATIGVLGMLLVWFVVRRERFALHLFVFCAVVFSTLLIFRPLLLDRLDQSNLPVTLSADYEPEFNAITRRPNEDGVLMVRIRNSGTTTWPSDDQPITITHRWYDADKKKFLREAKNYIPIPTPLRPKESVVVNGAFSTPSEPGLYLMTWDIFYPGRGWLSANGIYPGLVEVQVRQVDKESSGVTDISRWFRRDTSRLFVANVPFSRSELWRSALGLAREHPILGVGPDNFRLLYGRQFGIDRWDTKIRANNMYLELLAGSGLVGLAAFCIMMLAARWTAGALSLALGIFLVHGFVDVFLMTTPIYFAFWILLGQIQCTSSASTTPSRTP